MKQTAGILGVIGGLLTFTVPLTLLCHNGSHVELQLRFLFFTIGVEALIFAASIGLQEQLHAQSLLRTEERLQYKDAVSIGTAFILLLTAALYVVAATAEAAFQPGAAMVFMTLAAALAATAIGGAFGFLFGLPHMDATTVADARAKTFLGMRIRTGLDDIVDWLVKGITTVLLVNMWPAIEKFKVIANKLALGLRNPAKDWIPIL